jgi:predicted HTH transcriptional regulator
MILKQLNEIDEKVLSELVTNAVSEGRAIEYKRDLPSNSDADKKEFLADVSSFANTSGGDLIFGVDESGGVPTQIIGIQSGDLDLEIGRLNSIIQMGLDPRIRYDVRTVTFQDGRKVPIIRIERSWIGPHRVVFKGHDKFYARNSTGKYPLDFNELRLAFTFKWNHARARRG